MKKIPPYGGRIALLSAALALSFFVVTAPAQASVHTGLETVSTTNVTVLHDHMIGSQDMISHFFDKGDITETGERQAMDFVRIDLDTKAGMGGDNHGGYYDKASYDDQGDTETERGMSIAVSARSSLTSGASLVDDAYAPTIMLAA